MIRILLLALAAAGLTLGAPPAWDSTGDGLLTGIYNFRQVMYITDSSGNINHEFAYFGNISFDGKGGYTLSGSNMLNDSLPNLIGTLAIPTAGTYSVATSGYGFLSNPLAPDQSVYFLVSNGILLGSATENPGANSSFNNDLFIAAPATPTFTNASFNGTYTFANFEPNLDLSFQLNPTGTGILGPVTRSGYVNGGTASGTNASVSYAFSNGVCTLNFGSDGINTRIGGGVVTTTTFYGHEILYISPDTNFAFGGSPNGYDILVGVRGATTTATLTNSLYYEIGLDQEYLSDHTSRIDSYYGVFNAFSGTTIGHERLLYAGSSAEGVTYTTTYPTGSYTGPANVDQLDPAATAQYTVGTGGIRIGFGIGPWLGIEVALPAPAQTPSGSVYIDPTGVVNTASSAPFTAGISPGEFVSLYNGVDTGNSATPCATGAPFPAMLGNIQVLVNGVAAPIYCVGSGNAPVTFIVPDAVSQNPVATIQVMNGSTLSNTVTAFVYKTTPGVLTFSPVGGIGFAAAEHADYSLITPANPAKPGETIAVYLTGLGNPVPASGIAINVAGVSSTSIPYAGLTTDPGLYQINFQVPAAAPNGNDVLAIVGPDSWSSESLLPVAGQSQSASGTNRQ
jgi:uncharacterized protein (TIGR03437 family)